MNEEKPELKKHVVKIKKSSLKHFIFLLFIFLTGMAVQKYILLSGQC